MSEAYSKEKNFDLEAVYDAEIAPLMDQIIKVCMEYKLPMFATFQYRSDPEGLDDGEDRFCTTNIPCCDERPTNDNLLQLIPTLNRKRHHAVAITVTTPKAVN